MRYSLAILLAVGIGITTSTHVVVDQNGPGRACYMDGVVSSCTPPAPVYLGIGSSAEASARVTDANASAASASTAARITGVRSAGAEIFAIAGI